MIRVTPGTGGHALVANVVTALGTAIWVVILTDLPATIGTAHPVPMVKLDISTSGVIGLKRLTDDREKVKQPALFERSTDGQMGLSLAQTLGIDVRMGDV